MKIYNCLFCKKLYNTVSILLLVMILPVLSQVKAQIPTVQDCLGAIPVCQSFYSQPNSFQGTGNYPNEINPDQVCPNSCMDGEKNDAWYIITVKSSGLLRLSIDPNNDNDDYDWAVYNLTNHTCSEIYNNAASMQASCNAYGSGGFNGATGISTANGGLHNCENGGVTNKWNVDLPVVAGETYVLCVSNWTQTQGGYTLDFGASTASIFDDVPPGIDSVAGYVGCTPVTHLTMWFSENVLCATVQGSDFLLKGPNNEIYNVSSSSGTNCLFGDQEKKFTLTFSPPIFTPGTYTLQVVDTITDLCGNNAGTIFAYPFQITNGVPAVSFSGLNASYCQTAAQDTLYGNHQPASGTGTFSGPGITNLGNDKAVFDPATVSIGVNLDIKYTYTSPSGCTEDTVKTIMVGLAPVQYNITGGGLYCEGGNGVEIGLDDSESGKQYELLLNGSSLIPPVTTNGTGNPISFGLQTQTGDYTVKASSSGCSIMMLGNTTINIKPTPAIFTMTGGGQFCADVSGVPVGLSGSQVGTTYELLLNGNPLTPPNVQPGTGNSIDFGNQNLVGTYSAKATLDACVSIMDGSVSVNYYQNPQANAGVDQTIPMGTFTQLHGSATNGTGPYTYHWEPAAMLNDPDIQEPTTVNLTSSQIFTLKVTDANGCYTVDQVMVTVAGGPLTVNVMANRINICLGDTTLLNALPSGGNGTYTYTWTSTPAGFNSSIQSPIVTPDETTTYNCDVFDGFNHISGFVTVNVHSIPVAEAGLDITVDYGASATLDGTGSHGGTTPYQYHWEPAALIQGSPDIATPTTISLTSNQQFTLTLTDTWGCSSSDFAYVLVPGGAVSVSPYAQPDSICLGDSTTLFSGVMGGTGDYQYYWQSIPVGFTSEEPNPEVSPSETTTYIVEVYDGINSISGAAIVNIKLLPEINLIPAGAHVYGQDTIITCIYDTLNLSAGNPNCIYLWSNGSNMQNIEIQTTGIAFDIQSYRVEVYNPVSGCNNSDTLTVIFTFSECGYGIGEKEHDNTVYVFPNPTDGKFVLMYSGNSLNADFLVYDTFGKLALKGKLKCNGGEKCIKEIDLRNYPAGLYYITVNGDGWTKNIKIVKQ